MAVVPRRADGRGPCVAACVAAGRLGGCGMSGLVTKLLHRGAEVATVPEVCQAGGVGSRPDASQPSPAVSQGRGGVPQSDDSGGPAGGAARVVPSVAQAQGDGKTPVGSEAKNEPTPPGAGAG